MLFGAALCIFVYGTSLVIDAADIRHACCTEHLNHSHVATELAAMPRYTFRLYVRYSILGPSTRATATPASTYTYVYAVVILHSSFVVWRTRVCMCYRPPSLACGCSGVCSVCTPLHDACDYGYARLHPIIIVMVLCTLVCTHPALIARANSPTHARCMCCLCSVMHSRSRRR